METLEDAQAVIDVYHSGSATVLWDNPDSVMTVVKFEGVTGKYVLNSGEELATNIFQIRGASPHVVPVAPSGRWAP